MPVKEVSAESVRDKSIRHGHISTLHLWWARRPLPVCRAVVFASLVPDPLDPDCPQAFREAVDLLLGLDANGLDPYLPYADIPYTAGEDRMEDNRRNRLLMFIGKFSDTYVANERKGKVTPAKDLLSNGSLIKWDNKNNEAIIGKARQLIWVAHNAHTGASAQDLLANFQTHHKAIKDAETALYSIQDRHITAPETVNAQANLHDAIEGFLDHMPKVFDPFAGGGAIPLEAARLGCRSFGNDINPVAHIIQKGSLEFPQKYGKPITYSKAEFLKLYGEAELEKIPNDRRVYTDGNVVAVKVPNRLSFDVEFYAKKLLSMTEAEIGHLYPSDENGRKPIAYYWARVATCSNPSCGAEVPLLKSFYLANSKSGQVYLRPTISGKLIDFEIANGPCQEEGWVHSRKNLRCPICGNHTSNGEIKKQFLKGETKTKMLAVIWGSESGKNYRKPTEKEQNVIIPALNFGQPLNESLAVNNTKQFDLCPWGFVKFSDMFTERQIYALQFLVSKIEYLKTEMVFNDLDYAKAIFTYLGILLDRVATRLTSFGIWNTIAETLEHPFGRQAIPMVFDFPESNPFTSLTGGMSNQLEWITRYINSEVGDFAGICINASSGDREQFAGKSIDVVVTDPPYYDAIAYADLSDFFYVWLKRSLSKIYPSNFATPQTPKTDECTALKHHHGGNLKLAKSHFEMKLSEIFRAIEHQTISLVSIMFAHQSTEAWTTLCKSILNSGMNFTSSWAIDTERSSAGVKAASAFLSSSVTVSARPAQRQGFGSFKEVKKAIEVTVAKEVEELYKLGFRGADLLTACFGQAVSEFGRYEKVEKADGKEVMVAELLEMARESAFDALVKGFDGDQYTKFYIAWLQLCGFAESDFDDAAQFARVGLTIDVNELFTSHILIKHGNKQTLGDATERIKISPHLGQANDSPLIDQVHRAMDLFKGSDREVLLTYIAKVAGTPDSGVWRVLTSLAELLPTSSDDHKQALGLLSNKDSLMRESKQPKAGTQSTLF